MWKSGLRVMVLAGGCHSLKLFETWLKSEVPDLCLLSDCLICSNILYVKHLGRKMEKDSHLKISPSTRVLVYKMRFGDKTWETLFGTTKSPGFRFRQILMKFLIPSTRWTVWTWENQSVCDLMLSSLAQLWELNMKLSIKPLVQTQVMSAL